MRAGGGGFAVSRVRLSAAPWTAARQAPESADFARQEHGSPALAGGLFTTSASWEDPSDAYSQFLVPQTVKHLSAMQETRLRSLGGEDPPGEGSGSPPQDSCLQSPMDRAAWPAAVRGVAESRIQRGD